MKNPNRLDTVNDTALSCEASNETDNHYQNGNIMIPNPDRQNEATEDMASTETLADTILAILQDVVAPIRTLGREQYYTAERIAYIGGGEIVHDPKFKAFPWFIGTVVRERDTATEIDRCGGSLAYVDDLWAEFLQRYDGTYDTLTEWGVGLSECLGEQDFSFLPYVDWQSVAVEYDREGWRFVCEHDGTLHVFASPVT